MKPYFLRTLSLSCLLTALIPPAYAGVDPACAPVIKASLTRAAAPAWESVAVMGGGSFKLEAMKINGQHYMRTNGERWKKAPVDLSEAERQMVAQINNGTIKLTQCRDEGNGTIDGVATRIISFTVAMKGAPASSTKLHVGKSDNLPYAQMADTVKVRYRYTGLTAPKL